MNSIKKYKYWLEAAQYDLESARVMLAGSRYMYVAFMSQQAIEKLTKGIYLLYTDKEPPRSHNSWGILMRTRKETDLKECSLESELNRNMAKYKDFFAELLSYYISGRYPMYKQKISEGIDADRATKILNTTEEVFLWLKSLSRYKL